MAIISDPSIFSFQRINRIIQMEQQQEEDWRKYPSGKSLGGVQGHIKSHIPANSADLEEKFDPDSKKVSSFNGEKSFKNGGGGGGGGGELGGHSGYGLRENPKKTFKAADYNFQLPQEKVCKQCGKGFQSLKALCGHMACHSEKDRSLKDDHSWTSENQKVVTTDDSVSDTESEDRRVIISSSRSRNNTNNNNNKRYKRIIIKSSNMSMANNGSSSISEIDEQEQEEVAMCLMMLSRDSSNWGGVNSVVESSDNNSVVLETNNGGRKEEEEGGLMKNTIPNSPPDDETTPQTRRNVLSRKKILLLDDDDEDDDDEKQANSDSGYFLGEEQVKVESDGSIDGFHRNPYSSVNEKTKKRSKMGVTGTAAAAEETLAEIRKGFGKLRKDRDRGRGRDRDRYRYRYRDREEEEEVEEEEEEEERNAVVTKYDEPRKKIKNSYDHLETMNESCNKKVRKHGGGSLDVETQAQPTSKNTKHKKTKYECLNCKKIFSSYQALGGHRPCHKRNNAYFDSRYETGENCLEGGDAAIEDRKLGDSFNNNYRKAAAANGNKDNISSGRVDKKMIKSRKNKGHECPFCHRIFKNGQALGGHKRSHFIGGTAEEIHHHHHHHQQQQQTSSGFKTDYSELFDLNLPARPED